MLRTRCLLAAPALETAPGVHLLRLSHGGAVRTARVTVVR